ncbi:MAG: hypothetical protein IKM39_02835 [Clostridia bacterium]|nr:hypothetical protein [Clostridia bacterium]
MLFAKRFVAMVLSIIMSITMVASTAVADTEANIVDLQLRSCDDTGWQNTPRGEFFRDVDNFTEGTGSIRLGLDRRSGVKVMNAWLGSIDGRTANTDTLDISSTYNENGEFYITMDFWAAPEKLAELNAGRFVVGVFARPAAQTAGTLDSAKEGLQIDKAYNADWSVWGIDELQAGWNHLAAKVTDLNGTCNFAHSGNYATYWDPTTVWGVKFNYQQLNWEDAEDFTYSIRLDDIRFMSVDAYEANFASRNRVKNVIIALNDVKDKNDEEGLAKFQALYENLTSQEQAQVSNLSRLDELFADPLDVALEGGTSYFDVAAGNLYHFAYVTENYTQGSDAFYSDWGGSASVNDTTQKLYFSIISDVGWDFSQVDYISFDIYIYGFESNWINGTNDIGSWMGTQAVWNSSDIARMQNVAFDQYVKDWQPGWNHVVIPLAEYTSGSITANVKNINFYFEKAITITQENPYVIIDDFRIMNENALLDIDSVRTPAKWVIAQIAGLQHPLDTEGIALAKAAYGALTAEQQAYVTNYSNVTRLEAAAEAGSQFDAKIAALPANITYAHRTAVLELQAQYNGLDSLERQAVTKKSALDAAVAVVNTMQSKVDSVITKIDAIPALSELTLEDESLVVNARTAYDALDVELTAGVTNYQALLDAEAKLIVLEQTAVDLNNAIAALPNAADVILEDRAAIEQVAAQYDAFSQRQKDLVTEENTAKLSAVREALAIQLADKAAADAISNQIAALPAVEALTLENETAVYTAHKGYDALNDNAKSYVIGVDVLQAAVARMDEIVNTTVPMFTVENAAAKAGETFTVAVNVKNNPGIVSLKVAVGYDSSILEVVGMEAGEFADVAFSPTTANPVLISWVDGLHPDNTTNGVVAYITFKVKEDAGLGTTALTISHNPNDVFDFDYNNVTFRNSQGLVTIADYTPGDLDDSGQVDNKDLALLQRYLNDWNVVINEYAAEVNGDGVLDNKDFSVLQRYLNGWDIRLQ